MIKPFKQFASFYEEAMMSELLYSMHRLDVTLEEIELFCNKYESECKRMTQEEEYNKGRIR